MTDLTVNITKTINASIDKVFDAWLNPKMLSQFILPMPGMPEPETEKQALIIKLLTLNNKMASLLK